MPVATDIYRRLFAAQRGSTPVPFIFVVLSLLLIAGSTLMVLQGFAGVMSDTSKKAGEYMLIIILGIVMGILGILSGLIAGVIHIHNARSRAVLRPSVHPADSGRQPLDSAGVPPAPGGKGIRAEAPVEKASFREVFIGTTVGIGFITLSFFFFAVVGISVALFGFIYWAFKDFTLF
ncbi:hypothetical protein ACFLU6_11730 [Acidobacteriota bacterium]